MGAHTSAAGPNEHNARNWREDVRRGNFDALPEPLTWDEASQFVYLLNGYEILDAEKLGDLANRKLLHAKTHASWSGSARDIWLCLFYENRRWRHFGDWPEGIDLEILNDLCNALRRALVTLDQDGRDEMVRLMEAHPCPWK